MGGLFGKMPNIMGKVVFEDPVHHISGKISKKFRTTYNYRKASERKYTSVRGERTTPVSADEIAQRLKFKTIRLAALARSKDLAHMSQDQVAYKEEKKAQKAAEKEAKKAAKEAQKGASASEKERAKAQLKANKEAAKAAKAAEKEAAKEAKAAEKEAAKEAKAAAKRNR